MVHLFGRHAREVAAPFRHLCEVLVADDVELFLLFTLHVDAGGDVGRGLAEHAAELTKGHRAGDGLAGQGHVEQQRVEVAAGAGKAAALFDQVLREREAAARGHGGLSWELLNALGGGAMRQALAFLRSVFITVW
ncbi:hypothetical protein FQZ97_1050280 [compost metagenome]